MVIKKNSQKKRVLHQVTERLDESNSIPFNKNIMIVVHVRWERCYEMK